MSAGRMKVHGAFGRARRVVTGAVLIAVALLFAGPSAARSDDLAIWSDFLHALRSGGMADSSRYRTYDPALRAPMMAMLETLRGMLVWDSCTVAPEVVRVGDQVHFIVPLVLREKGATDRGTFCFTFVGRPERWYFQHLESILLRLDRIGPAPVSVFPDLPEEQKAWMRDELQTSADITHYVTLAREKGRDAAQRWFWDGAGYALAARAWVPFVPPERAFILYLCWEQANLRGQKVTLEALDDTTARVRLTPRYFELYRRAAHLRTQVGEAEYRELFESIWTDRATQGGWRLAFTYEGDDCVFRFTRLSRNQR